MNQELSRDELDDVAQRWMAGMFAGDFESAWQQTDLIEIPRRAAEQAGTLRWRPHHLVWNGAPFSGKRVLVRCNHGLGDTLQFARFLRPLSEIAAAVTVMAQPPLVRFLAGVRGIGEVRDGWNDAPPRKHDVEIEIMELAYAFRCTVESVPSPLLDPLLPKLALKGAGFRVGLVWAASDWNPERSVPLAALHSCKAVESVRFFSLQQGPEADDWSRAPFEIEPLSERTRGVAEAAAAMLEMDGIITVDSMVAHLAGVLGRPVWVLLQHEADWRWMCDRSDSPWYPGMRLFRQPARGDWQSVGDAVARQLTLAAQDARSLRSRQSAETCPRR